MTTGTARLMALLVLAGIPACGGGDGGVNGPPVVTTVEISPNPATVFMGDTIQLTATPKDQHGSAMAGLEVTWSSDAPTVAAIDSLGKVVAKASGTARISAAVEGKTGSVTLTSTGPGTTGAVTGSATIGATGGTVQATLPGGGTLGLAIPAGALRTAATITLEPLVPPPGSLASFRLTPAGVRFDKEATLVIKVSAGAKLRSTSTLVIAQGGQSIPVPSERNLSDGTLTVRLSALGLPETSPVFASRMRAFQANAADSSSAIGTVENLDVEVLFRAAQAALDQMIASGTVADAERMNIVMETLTIIDFNAINDSRFTPLRTQWTNSVCASAQFAFNALSSFNFVSDYRGLERAMAGVVQWHRVAQEMDTYVQSVVAVPTCFSTLPDAQTRVHTKLTALEPSIVADLNGFAVEPPPQAASFFNDRLQPLIDLAATFEQANFDAEVEIINRIIGGQTTRLRPIGYARCRSSPADQEIQGHLARSLQAGAIPGPDLSEIQSDIALCGMSILWDVLDSAGVSVSHGVLGGGDVQGQETTSGSATLAGDGQLKLSRGLIQALLCPSPASANNEQLEVLAGRNATSLTRVAVVSPSNSNQYLASSSLLIGTDTLRRAAGLAPADTGLVTIVIRRTGGLCSGMLGLFEHTTLGTLRLTLAHDPTLYFKDFNAGPAGSEWSTAQVSTSPSGQRFLGELGNSSTTLSLDSLPAHTQLVLDVDIYIIDSWNGNGGQGSASAPDIIEISVVGGAVLKRTTFSNKPSDVQAFPGDYPGGVNPAGTGALGKSTLGYDQDPDHFGDSSYRLRLTFNHTGGSIAIRFASQQTSGQNERWGIDNVRLSRSP